MSTHNRQDGPCRRQFGCTGGLRFVTRTVVALSLACMSANAGGAEDKPAYQLTVGLALLESEAPPGDKSGAGEFSVTARRDDPVVSRELDAVNERIDVLRSNRRKINCLIKEITEAGKPDPATRADGSKEPDGDSAERPKRIDDEVLARECRIKNIGRYRKRDATADRSKTLEHELASLHEQLEDIESKLMPLREITKELSSLLTGHTLTISTRENRMHFTDAPILKVYQGDKVRVTLVESDVFENDLYGQKTFVIDEAMLEAGYVELDTGWVESLHLGFVPLE